MHRAQPHGLRVALVAGARVLQHVGDIRLRLGQGHAGVALAGRDGTGGHRRLQLAGHHDVAHLHVDDVDPPAVQLRLQHLFQLGVQLVAPTGHLSQARAPDGRPQRGLGHPRHGARVVLHLAGRLLRGKHHPEHHGIHVHGHQVGRERLLGAEVGGRHALVDAHRVELDNGPSEHNARPRYAIEAAEAHDHGALPFHDDVHRRGGQDADHHGDHEGREADAAREGLGAGEHQRANGGEHDDGERHGAVARGAVTPRFQPRARLRRPLLRARGT